MSKQFTSEWLAERDRKFSHGNGGLVGPTSQASIGIIPTGDEMGGCTVAEASASAVIIGRSNPTEVLHEPGIEGEGDQHKRFCQWLNLSGFYGMYVHAPFGKKSQLPEGHPDFGIYGAGGKVVFVEFKFGDNKPDATQVKYMTELSGKGFATCVAWTVVDAVEFVKKELRL